MIRILLLTTIFAISLISCSNPVKEAVTGWWTIDTFYYKGEDVRLCMYTNSIFFNKEDMDMPISETRCENFQTFEKKGDWQILDYESKPLSLNIESKNNVFAGNHKIVFKRDEANKLLKMEIISDNLYLVCRKGMFCYDCNQELIDDLVTRSNKEK